MAGLLNEGFDPAAAGLEAGIEGELDPRLQHLVADEDATDEENEVMAEALVDMMDFLYSDKGLAAVVQAIKAGGREPFESIPEVVVPILQKVRGQNPNADATTFFAEGGLIQEAVDRVIEIAEVEGLVDPDDAEMQQATIINLYRKIGELLEAEGDDTTKTEATELAMNMGRTQDDGSLASMESMKQPNVMNEAVKQGLGL